MTQLNGFIKIHRKLVRWGWYTDNVVKCLFLHLLLTASFKESEWMGRTILPGQSITSYPTLSRDLQFSIQQIRTALSKLKSTGEITVEATCKYQVITVVNWEEYQAFECDPTDKSTEALTGQQQTSNRQSTGNQHHRKNTRRQEDKKENGGCAASAPLGQGDEAEKERLAHIAELRR